MKKIAVLFVLVLLLGGGGAAAWFFYLDPSREQTAAPYEPLFIELDRVIVPVIDDDQVVQQIVLKITLELDAGKEEQVLLAQRNLRDAFLTELHRVLSLRVVREMETLRPFLQDRLETAAEEVLGPGVLERILVAELVRRRTLGS